MDCAHFRIETIVFFHLIQRVCLRRNLGCECVVELPGNDAFQVPFFALGHTVLLSHLIHGDNAFPLYERG